MIISMIQQNYFQICIFGCSFRYSAKLFFPCTYLFEFILFY